MNSAATTLLSVPLTGSRQPQNQPGKAAPGEGHEPIPVIYGYTSTPGILVFQETGANFRSNAGRQLGNLSAGTGRASEYLLTQRVVSVGEISSLRGVLLDGRSPSPAITNSSAHRMDFNQASPWAADYRGDNSTAVFSGLTQITSVYRCDPQNPQYGGPPQPIFLVEGRRLRPVQKSGDNYSLGQPASSRLTPLVLLDYLTSSDYGPGLNLEDLDLASFYAAQQMAAAVVETGFWSTELAGGDIDLHRYEFNGSLTVTSNYPAVIDEILRTMPGAMLYQAADTGKYKLCLASNASVASQTVATLTGSQIRVDWSRDTRLGSLSGNFSNGKAGFQQDSLTFPAPGTAVTIRTAAEDGSLSKAGEMNLSGVASLPQAASICCTEMLLTRREGYSLTTAPGTSMVEPGDILRLQDTKLGLDVHVRVQKARLLDNLTVEIEAVRHVPGDFDWTPGNYTRTQPPEAADPVLTAPSLSVVWIEDDRVLAVTLAAAPNEDACLEDYELQYRLADTWYGWARSSSLNLRLPVSMDGGSYSFRARARGANGRKGPWSEPTEEQRVPRLQIEPGPAGEPGQGTEFIFTATADRTAPTAPSADWGYRRPTDGWTANIASLADGACLWMASRSVSGSPATGDAVSGLWSSPVCISRVGLDGARGPAGAKGETGDAGPAGPEGATGPRGLRGYTGNTGPRGYRGLKGDQGNPGPAGSRGFRGFKGDKGDQGPTGSVGPRGPRGDTGPRGPAGEDGRSWVPYGMTASPGRIELARVASFPQNPAQSGYPQNHPLSSQVRAVTITVSGGGLNSPVSETWHAGFGGFGNAGVVWTRIGARAREGVIERSGSTFRFRPSAGSAIVASVQVIVDYDPVDL